MTLKQFESKFSELKNKGFIPSERKGPTGIGYTLEKALGLEENNISMPDLKDIELKAHRSQTNNLITLFTFNRKAWMIPPLEAIDKYGSYDKNGRKGLYYTMLLKPNSAGLFLHISKKQISVRHNVL